MTLCKLCEQNKEYKYGLCYGCLKPIPNPKQEVIDMLSPLVDNFLSAVTRLRVALEDFQKREEEIKQEYNICQSTPKQENT